MGSNRTNDLIFKICAKMVVFKFKLTLKLELNLFWLGLRFVFVFKLFKTPMPFLRPVDSV